jgi:Ras family protein A
MTSNTKVVIEKSRKLVVVGDGMCGKTCLLYAFKDDDFNPNHAPTIFDTYAAEIKVNGKTVTKNQIIFSSISKTYFFCLQITLALFDTAGEEDFDRLRPLSYPDTNVVLICFSVGNSASAVNVSDKWSPEIRHFCDQCPIILVACKTDLRTNPQTIAKLKLDGAKPVTTEFGQRLATQIKADAYMECSAKTREGVQELFMLAARLSLEKRSRRKKHPKCALY